MDTWFDSCNAPGARIRAHGSLYPMFIGQTMWFGMPDVCSVKGEQVEHVIEGHKMSNGNNV